EGGTIRIDGLVSKGLVKISVSDDGIGISAEDLPRIFDLFYRGTASRREEGMGMGLAVVKTVADSHGWEIRAASEPGKGSVFTIEIPYDA
ncbi:MAG TPA: sensor histidine kinase, partial [bacterium]|nr:sensor histidine kinase [bacterium]